MSERETRRDPSRPATRSNYVATPAGDQLRDPTLPSGLHEADPLGRNHPRIYDHSKGQPQRDTESLKGARDAGPPGGWVDDPDMPSQRWDTEVPQGPRDAGSLGSRRPWIDEPPGLLRHGDTVKPPGSRDAGLASSRRSKVDETPRPLTLESPVASKTPRRRSEIGLKALQIDSKTDYERKYGNLPESVARSRTEFSDVITPTPFRAPSIPSEEESPRLL